MRTNGNKRSWVRAATGIGLIGACFQLGFLGSCEDRFIGFTTFFDPCGTILGNCAPGSFETNAADVGDFCVDPTCTVPGQCGNAGPALGTVRDICP